MEAKKRIISISGRLGSGKSSAAKQVAAQLGFQHFSSGDFLRKVAQERNMAIHELMIAAETDSSIDFDIDASLKEKRNEDNLVIDSRLAFHWIPHSFKVYLDIDFDIAAKRMYEDLENNTLRSSSEQAASLAEMKRNMHERHASDIKRYKKLYAIDYTDHHNFDLVIDTGKPENDKRAVVQKIIEHAEKYFSRST